MSPRVVVRTIPCSMVETITWPVISDGPDGTSVFQSANADYDFGANTRNCRTAEFLRETGATRPAVSVRPE